MWWGARGRGSKMCRPGWGRGTIMTLRCEARVGIRNYRKRMIVMVVDKIG